MKKVFIAYADAALAYSLKRIGRQARRIRVFDEVRLYTPADLPEDLKAHPLMQYSRGGGYWIWKPWLIRKTLQEHAQGDIVVYADAGSTLRKSPEWDKLFGLMADYDTLCFQYAESVPEFARWGNSSTHIKYWTKKNTLAFLDGYFHDNAYRDNCKIMGGLLFMKNKENSLLRQWLDISLNHPELIIDPNPEEEKDQEPGFAYHKHEQSIITALAYYDKTVCMLPETYEEYRPDSFAWASRCRAANFREFMLWKAKTDARHLLGDHRIENLKRFFGKFH
ncbi:MAG: hypothetical protein IJK90_05810 [Bacteroidales bacterium]|nr:hypothetical protein [Bacteroidales bacterium]